MISGKFSLKFNRLYWVESHDHIPGMRQQVVQFIFCPTQITSETQTAGYNHTPQPENLIMVRNDHDLYHF